MRLASLDIDLEVRARRRPEAVRRDVPRHITSSNHVHSKVSLCKMADATFARFDRQRRLIGAALTTDGTDA